jgi:hypothetical protein
VNRSQSKFVGGTWPISKHGQDHIAIASLSAFGTIAKTQIDADKNPCDSDDKNQIKTQFMSSQTFQRIPCERELKNMV